MLVAAKRDDGAVLAKLPDLPLGDGLFALKAPFKENIDRHGKCQLANGDVHPSALNAVFRAIFDPSWQSHKQLPCLDTSEQGNRGGQSALNKPVSKKYATSRSSLSRCGA